MPQPSKIAMQRLCEHLHIEENFFLACLQEAVIDVSEVEGTLELTNGTALRLRRLQRICLTFNVDLTVAVLLSGSKVNENTYR